jgi:hypothetical protein
MSPAIRRAQTAHEISEHRTGLNVGTLLWTIASALLLANMPAIVRALWGLTR